VTDRSGPDDGPVLFGTAVERAEKAEATVFTPASGSIEADSPSAVADSEPADVSEASKPIRRPLLIAARVLMALISVAALVGMTILWTRVDRLQSSVNKTDALAAAQEAPGAPAQDDGANDILVVGSDTRTDLQGRPLSNKILKELRTEATDGTLNTDTLILLRLPKSGGKGYAISIPRDVYVPVPGSRDEKINGAYGVTKARITQDMVRAGEKDREKIERDSDTAGRTALIQTVQGLTGVRIDHYAEVTLYGFYLLTQAIDGVDVCLNRSTSDPDSGANFRRGPQTVRGPDAVSFVRQRKNLPRGDLDRIVRQQTFLSSAMNKVLSGGMLTDSNRLDALADAVSKTVVMDPGLHFLDLVNQAQALASGKVEFVTIPVGAVGARNDRGQSIIAVDIPTVQAYVAALVTATPPPPPPPVSAPPEDSPRLAGPHLLNLNATKDFTVPCID
jgi:LCP family protein required for cell wall assembly